MTSLPGDAGLNQKRASRGDQRPSLVEAPLDPALFATVSVNALQQPLRVHKVKVVAEQGDRAGVREPFSLSTGMSS